MASLKLELPPILLDDGKDVPKELPMVTSPDCASLLPTRTMGIGACILAMRGVDDCNAPWMCTGEIGGIALSISCIVRSLFVDGDGDLLSKGVCWVSLIAILQEAQRIKSELSDETTMCPPRWDVGRVGETQRRRGCNPLAS